MRTSLSALSRRALRAAVPAVAATGLTALTLLATATPAFAQAADGGGKPWHYWIAPVLLLGFLATAAAVALGYWVRVHGGPRRRG